MLPINIRLTHKLIICGQAGQECDKFLYSCSWVIKINTWGNQKYSNTIYYTICKTHTTPNQPQRACVHERHRFLSQIFVWSQSHTAQPLPYSIPMIRFNQIVISPSPVNVTRSTHAPQDNTIYEYIFIRANPYRMLFHIVLECVFFGFALTATRLSAIYVQSFFPRGGRKIHTKNEYFSHSKHTFELFIKFPQIRAAWKVLWLYELDFSVRVFLLR